MLGGPHIYHLRGGFSVGMENKHQSSILFTSSKSDLVNLSKSPCDLSQGQPTGWDAWCQVVSTRDLRKIRRKCGSYCTWQCSHFPTSLHLCPQPSFSMNYWATLQFPNEVSSASLPFPTNPAAGSIGPGFFWHGGGSPIWLCWRRSCGRWDCGWCSPLPDPASFVPVA